MVGCQLVILSFDRGKLHICWREDGQKSLLVERSKSHLGDDVHENIIEKENFKDKHILKQDGQEEEILMDYVNENYVQDMTSCRIILGESCPDFKEKNDHEIS